MFLTSEIPIRPFQAEFTIFTDAWTQGWGAHMGDLQIAGVWTRLQRESPHQCAGAQGGNIGPPSLGYSITGLSCFDTYRQYHCCSLHQQTRWTHSHLLLWLVVDLFLWLQTRDITLRARHILGCLNLIADGLSRLNQPITTKWSLHPEVVNLMFRLWGTPVVDMFATVHHMHLPQFMSPVPEPRSLAIDA